MEQNIFVELYEKKKNIIALTEKTVEFGWIEEERGKEIIEKLEKDVLTIGVIGQMKCGKSTFLNSFIFEDDVLPAATTPMTAALSVITYGAEKKIVAEFYTIDEWEEQKIQAARSLDEVQGNTLEESKIKAARELVDRSSKLGSNLCSFLGKKQEDEFVNLIEYVGAEGKYISITKAVTIYYPREYLKGVEVVDTPGFNDPIVSREERTKAFLNKADVVLMMLYAGRPFDSTDRDILFKNVRQCGVGKVLIGINKYDIPYCNGETEVQIKNYVKDEIEKACRICNDDSLTDLLRKVEPIPISAEMALLSELPMSRISADPVWNFAWNRYCDPFEIGNQKQMREKSHIDQLAFAVKQMVEVEKGQILFAKPINALLAAGNKKFEDIDKCLRENEELVKNLSIPDEELEEKEERLNKAERRLNKKIEALEEDLNVAFQNIIRKGRVELEDVVDASVKKMKQIIESWGIVSNIHKILPSLKEEEERLLTRYLKRSVEELNREAAKTVMSCVKDFMEEVEEVLRKNMEDFDSKSYVRQLSNKIQFEVNSDTFKVVNEEEEEEEEEGWGKFCLDFLNGATFGLMELAGNVLAHSEIKGKLLDLVNGISRDFDPDPSLQSITDGKLTVIENVKESLLNGLLHPMQEQIRLIRADRSDKTNRLTAAEQEVEKYKCKKTVIEAQIKEVENIKGV